MSGKKEREVLIELTQVGNAVKVTAVDPVTRTEVSIVGSPSDGEDRLKRTAINKLNYVLRKTAGEGRRESGPGTLV